MNDAWQSMLVLNRINDFTSTDPLYAFALDELLCRSAGKGGPAVCHIWRHPGAFIMGLRDSRMPHVQEARQWLESSGWATAVRNSGGAAVPLDAGVVNLSLIAPKTHVLDYHFHNDFEGMFALIREALKGTGRQVDKGEITGAYCPGDFDLSIDGFKFCGIAQRRQTHATIVQAFVVTEGSGSARAAFVRQFYDIASGGDDTLGHPLVSADSTASLEELAGLVPHGSHAFAQAVQQALGVAPPTPHAADAVQPSELQLPEPAEVEAMVATLRSRYTIGQ
ncbi:lipoate--protein ligase family protein [Paenibacillus chungangensis]|uniref:Biotin/lipoate A/B protein ligase family protein n=1 Tax=Paenibacillus chungangensis TaxID=696535 RepID=A0ABW3HWY1_9BACL